MTKVYFVRHAQPDHDWKEDRTRPLTEEGKKDSAIVLRFLKDREIDVFYCSPYKRSIDTIAEAAQFLGKEIITDERLREREKGPGGNQQGMFQKRWADLDYHEEGGESLKMVQKRNIEALHEILLNNSGKDIVIGTHGTALSTILNYYDQDFGCDDFLRIIDWMPYIIELDFEETRLIGKKEHCYVEKEFKGSKRADKMKVPSIEEAERLIEEAAELNPGPWIEHNKTAGFCARKIAEKCVGMNPDVAYVMGLLHDIGRREGIMDMGHIYKGYLFMNSLGYDDSARICLTHSFPYKNIGAYNGQNDCSKEETEYIQKYLDNLVYDDYDRLIQLCDAISFPNGPTYVEKRLVDVVIRRGFNELTIPKWKAFLELKEYFDKKVGRDIYKVLNI